MLTLARMADQTKAATGKALGLKIVLGIFGSVPNRCIFVVLAKKFFFTQNNLSV